MLDINDSTILNEYLLRYDEAIKILSEKKVKKNLINLDKWLWNDLKKDVYERNEYCLTKTELSNIMRWKLLRGTFRPSLQSLVDSNSEDLVKECTGKAFNILCNDKTKWTEALKELMALKGIGVATASIILAIFSPEYCPFMSDEVINLFYTGKNPYTVSVYKNIQSKVIEKINQLNNNSDIVWNPEMFGKAVWSYEILK